VIAQLTSNVFLLDLPLLIVLTSLVYSASRHEDWKPILLEAFRWGARLALFMVTIVVVLLVVGYL
jgi:hypothetical protein